MGNRECEWVGARLPLWVDNSDRGAAEADGERGDLTARERGQVERHLLDCELCRRHRMALEQALGALAIAASHLPARTEVPSLWPLLEHRIADRDTEVPSLWPLLEHRIADRDKDTAGRWPRIMRGLTGRSIRPWGDLDSVRPLRQAWTRDTVGEMLAGRNRQKSDSTGLPGLVLKISVAAAVLVTLTGIASTRRQWKNAQSTILANSAPSAEPVVVPSVIDEQLPLETADRELNDVSATQLAEAEPPRPPDATTLATDAVAPPKPSPHTRFGFDLEHGTPMPHDTREAKPVY